MRKPCIFIKLPGHILHGPLFYPKPFMDNSKIDAFVRKINTWIRSDTTSGTLLLASTLAALIWINIDPNTYHLFWEKEIAVQVGNASVSGSLHHWINDGLMAMFFFTVGLELKREVIDGELSTRKKALFPFVCALGGMLVPAGIFIAINSSPPEMNGWGIPVATDIAFALGIVALLGNRIPPALRIFILALAIGDDLGAVLIIAFFYTSDISVLNLLAGAGFVVILLIANGIGIRSPVFYGLLGIGGVWFAFLFSGVHPTIAGVLAALTIPARKAISEYEFSSKLREQAASIQAITPATASIVKDEHMKLILNVKRLAAEADTPLQRLEKSLHPLVYLIVMPLFALANAGVELSSNFFTELASPIALGVFLGLLGGKVLGVSGAAYVMTKTNLGSLPSGADWKQFIGMAFLTAIGFTMSLFISNLAFGAGELSSSAKIGILSASLVAGIAGYVILSASSKNKDLGVQN